MIDLRRTSALVLLVVSAACSNSEAPAGPGGGGGSTGTAGNGAGASTASGDGGSGTGGSPSSGGGEPTGSGGDGASSGSGGAATGDRFVATDGDDSGDCTVNPCKSLAYAGSQMTSGEVLVMKDGEYGDSIDEDTFPRGSSTAFTVLRAEHDDAVTITGSFSVHANDDHFLQFEGIRFERSDEKGVAGGNVRFYRTTFVGGPDSGNSVNFSVGTNDFQPGAWDIVCEDCIFRGLGGRYAALVYRGENVTLRRAVARKDGGWGIGSSSATEFEPEGVITFYETQDSRCEQCVAIDSLKLSHSSAEALGAIIQNSHTNGHTNVAFTECFALANDFAGFSFEGNGSVGDASLTDCTSAKNGANGITANVDGDITLTHIASLDNDGSGVASYGDASMTLTASKVAGNGKQLDGVSGSTNGAGPNAIDLSAFDSARLRNELCTRANVSRGLCASSQTFQAYLESFQ